MEDLVIVEKIESMKKLIILVFIAFSCLSKTAAQSLQNDKSAVTAEYEYAITEATKQILFGNIKEAAILYNKCISENNKGSAAYFQLSNIALMIGDMVNALSYARIAYTLDKNNLWYGLNYFNILKINNRLDSALYIGEKLMYLNADDLSLNTQMLDVYSKLGKKNKALALISKLESDYGYNDELFTLKIKALQQLGMNEKALNELNNIYTTKGLNGEQLLLKAQLYIDSKREREAKTIIKDVFKSDSLSNSLLIEMLNMLTQINDTALKQDVFIRLMNNNDLPDEAKYRLLVTAIQTHENTPISDDIIEKTINILEKDNFDEKQIYAVRADFENIKGNIDSSLYYIKKIKELDPSNLGIRQRELELLSKKGNYNDLINEANKDLDDFNNNEIFEIYLGLGYLQEGQYELGKVALEKALRNDNSEEATIQMQMFLAEIYNKLKLYDESDSMFDLILKKEPENVMILNNYAYYLSLRSKSLNKAQKMSKITIEKEENNATYLDTYAWILYKQHEYRKALKYIKIAIKINNENNDTLFEHYGDILWRNNKKKEAESAWRKSCEIRKKDFILKDQINRLTNQ